MTKINLKELGRIGVLMGGCSSEREISLRSGKGVLQALQEAGCDVTAVEINSVEEKDVIALVNGAHIDVAFLALHGRFGEDGGIQTILEKIGIPYTGSDAKASRLAINKSSTQQALKKGGIPVPEFYSIPAQGKFVVNQIIKTVSLPAVVKPACEGSSIGIEIVDRAENLQAAIEKALGFGAEVVVERFIKGKELTAGIFDGQALPLVEIRPTTPFFDFTAKYQKGMTDYILPAEISPAAAREIQQIALQAFQLLGCRDFGRADFILDEEGKPYFLEMNTIPGFTSLSLLPKAAAKVGYNFTDLCLRLTELAIQRKNKKFLSKV